jgi:hypothetical protein
VPGIQRSDLNLPAAVGAAGRTVRTKAGGAARTKAGRAAGGKVVSVLARTWRGHRLMTVAVALSLVPRMLAALGFRPALLTPDSLSYLAQGVHLRTGTWHPAGYPVMLRLLEPFHSLLLVTSVQHLMGIATAVVGYAVLRHWRLPAWGAVLAASPTLFDARQVALESFILPDALYALLLTSAVALLLIRPTRATPVSPTPLRGSARLPGPPWLWSWRQKNVVAVTTTPNDKPLGAPRPRPPGTPRPSAARCALAGVLLAGAALTRGNGAPELAAVLAVLLIQRAGWRSLAAATVAFAVPVLSYMGIFAARHGNFALTDSDGMFLWSRTMSFANCAVIKPPPGLRPLCPDRQPHHPTGPAPAWSVPALLSARAPAQYLWATGVWWRTDAHPGFNPANDARGMRFALDAIRAQPAGYLRTVGSGVMLTFLSTDRSLSVRALHFTPAPDVHTLSRGQRAHLAAYAHTASNTHAVAPYSYFLYLYQQPVFFTGILFGLVTAAGLAGIIRARRQRGGLPALPWAVAAVGIVFPVAVHEYHYRYVISVVPAACLAAGLAFARRPTPPVTPATPTPAATRAATPAPALPARALAGRELAGLVPAPAPPPPQDNSPVDPRLPYPLPRLPRPRQPLTWQDEEL